MKLKNIYALAAISITLSGCSVGMALSGKKDPDLSVIKPGANRSVVELQLGSPIKTATLENGKTSAVYEYEMGNEPSAGRAVAHGAMDVLTFGIWEVVGTPIEIINGDKYQLTVTYNVDDKVSHVSTSQ